MLHSMPRLAELLFSFLYVHINVCPSVRDPVRLRLRHLYQVEFCSFMVRYPTSMYCGHICSYAPNFKEVGGAYCFWVVRPSVPPSVCHAF